MSQWSFLQLFKNAVLDFRMAYLASSFKTKTFFGLIRFRFLFEYKFHLAVNCYT